MSYISLQIGQCGNQLGFDFFNTVADAIYQKNVDVEFFEETKQRFFTESRLDNKCFARAVLVDTEPKVIRDTFDNVTKQPFWEYQENSSCIKKQGAANNWAMGYVYHGEQMHESILELLQREAERCDYVSGLLTFMSVAGGTGSGLGTFLNDVIKEEFSSVPIFNQVVWPFNKGEVTVQSYNALLTLSHLQGSADGITVFENDQLYKLCTQRMGMRDVTLNNLNAVASQQLACLLLPSLSDGISHLFGDILAHLVPHAQFKLLSLRSVPQEPPAARPFSYYTWDALLKTLRRMLLYNSVVDELMADLNEEQRTYRDQPISLANLLLLRGLDCKKANPEILHQPSLPYASWVFGDYRLQSWHHTAPVFGQDKIATLANNGQFLVPCIDTAVAKAWKMFKFKAYLHHYVQQGLSEDDFVQCFAQAEQIVASYKKLRTI